MSFDSRERGSSERETLPSSLGRFSASRPSCFEANLDAPDSPPFRQELLLNRDYTLYSFWYTLYT